MAGLSYWRWLGGRIWPLIIAVIWEHPAFGEVCVCKCACVCAHTKTPFDGRGFFLILEVLNKSWLLTKYTSHLTIDRASRQHPPPPHPVDLENQFREVPSESLLKQTKAGAGVRGFMDLVQPFSTPFFLPASHLWDHIHCPAHPSNAAPSLWMLYFSKDTTEFTRKLKW